MRKIVILGAGPTGLCLAKELAEMNHVTVLEKESYIGGLSSSFKYKGMTLDFGPHKFYTQIEGINDYFKKIVGKDTLKIKKRNSLRILGKYFSFPINPKQLIRNISTITVWNGIAIAASYVINMPKVVSIKKKPRNYEEYFIRGFGRKGYQVLFEGLAIKLWGKPKELSAELARKRVPISGFSDIIKLFFSRKKNRKVSAEFFYYPKRGFVQLLNNLKTEAEKSGAKFLLNTEIQSLELEKNKAIVKTVKKEIEADIIISTIPLNDVVNYVKNSPKEVKSAVKNLRYKGLIIGYAIINKNKVLNDNWIFFPQTDSLLNRVAELKSFSEYVFPEDKTVVTAEITYNKDGIMGAHDKIIKEKVIDELEKTGLVKKSEIEEVIIKRFKDVYPVYSINYRKHLKKVLDCLDSFDNFYTIGRSGLFNYNNTDHCFDMAMKLSKHIQNNEKKEEWIKLYNYFDTYRIVD